MMAADGIRLARRPALVLHAIACSVFLSGGIAAGCDILDAAGRAPDALVAWRGGALRLHGGAAMILLVALGALLPTHVRAAWTSGRNRVGGVAFLCALAALAATGYGLYYLGGEASRAAAKWTHLSLGLAEPALFAAHVVRGRRTRPPPQNVYAAWP